MRHAAAATTTAPVDALRRGGSAPDPPLLVDLLLDLDELGRLLRGELDRGNRLDAFLFAAGMNQIVEDYLHRDVIALDRVARILRRASVPIRAARTAALRLRSATAGERRLVAWQLSLQRLVEELAGDGEEVDAESVLSSMAALPRRLRRTIVRLPTSFRSLDQRPADLEAIANDFAARYPDRGRPLLVIGLRTSGSYLAPLYRRYLLAAGYARVEAMTLRPADGLLRREAALIARAGGQHALVLLVDDPPKSGSSLARAAKAVEDAGVPRGSIKMLLPLLAGADRAPRSLEAYEAVVLPWERWEIHRLLAQDALADTLDELLAGAGHVESAELVDIGPRRDLKAGSPGRRHIRGLVRASVRDSAGIQSRHEIYVKGIGLGYFGGHSMAVAEQLPDFFPQLYGVRDGLLFRQWVPERDRVAGGWRAYLPGVVGEYAAARAQRLAVTEDRSLRTVGLNPVWQRIADMLGRSYGRQRIVFRPVLHALARRLVRVRRPSVVDGSMALTQWFQAGDRLVKVDYDERAFSNQDTVIDQLYSYDPVYDLAMAAADHELETDGERTNSAFADELVQSFNSTSGTTIPAERWFLYQCLHLLSQQSFVRSLLAEVDAGAIPRDGLEHLTAGAVNETADRTARALARVDQRYLAETLWPERQAPVSGSLCAIDIDGVLETGRRGHSSATPAGVIALRALSLHGYVPVLATGRSAGEVIDRCRAFELAGGVAEYGAVAYDHRRRRLVELLEPIELDAIEQLRQSLRMTDGVHVDSAYRRVARASLTDGNSRRPLPDELVDRLLKQLGLESKIRVVHGLEQTDLAIARVDKRTGAQALARLLAPDAATSMLAFAIGDSAADLSILDEAGSAYAPSNSDAAVKASGARVMPGHHQAGLTQAVAELLGHAPGHCAVCRSPRVSRDAGLTLLALAASDAGRWSKLWSGVRLTVSLARQ